MLAPIMQEEPRNLRPGKQRQLERIRICLDGRLRIYGLPWQGAANSA